MGLRSVKGKARKDRVPRTTSRQKLGLVVLGAVLFTLCVGAIEMVLGSLDWGGAAPYRDPYVGFVPGSDLFERTGTGASARYRTRTEKLAFFNEQTFPAEKARDAYRVFVVGGSTVAGRPYDAHVAFPAWLERYLAARDPSRSWEVVNAGAISYASYRIAVLMEELVDLQPDLFVVYTGHNEFLEQRTYADVAHPPAWEVMAERGLARLRSWRLARRQVDHWRGSGDSEPVVPSTLTDEVTTKLAGWAGLDRYRRDRALESAVVEHFDFNLRRIVGLARQSGAEVILVTPVANLADFSPFKSEHREGLGGEAKARFEKLMRDGEAMHAAGSLGPARARFEAAREIDDQWAGVHFLLGRVALAQAVFDEARQALMTAKNLDVAPLRALDVIEERVTTVARDLEVPLIDLRSTLEADSRARFGHPILGEAYLLDHVHLNTAVHQRLATMIENWLANRGVAATAPTWSEAQRQAIDAEVLAGLDQRYYAQRDLNLGKVLGWAGKLAEAEAPLLRAAAVLEDDPELQLNLGILMLKTNRLGEAEAALSRVVALDPSRAEGWFNLGVVLGRSGDLEGGIRALRRAIAQRSDYPEAHHDLGTLLFRSAALDDAAAAFQRALALDPTAAPALRGLGLTYRRLGRRDEARRAFEQALTLEPASADAHYNLGLLNAESGDAAAAETSYERAVSIDPSHVAARTNLGILFAGAGRLKDAREQLEAAVATRPNAADAYLNLGVVRDQLGDADGALEAIRRAVDLAPENARARLALAMLLLARGDIAAAREHAAVAEAAGLTVPPALRGRFQP